MATGVEELFKVVPRFVDRTRRQAEVARHLLGLVPCLSTLVPSDRQERVPAGSERPEPVDVLGVLDGDASGDAPEEGVDQTGPADRSRSEQASSGTARSSTTQSGPAPNESDLAVQDYDSLAASQVVPRLVTLSEDELLAVQRYELANRHRQTILNRVAQLLDT